MILYTMMPQELIFPSDPESFSKQQTVNYQGIPLLVSLTDSQKAEVVRVLSTNPNDFMDERIYPGAKISFSELEGMSSFS